MSNARTSSRLIKRVQPWWVWCLGASFYAYENILQVSNGVMANQLMAFFKISATALGKMSSLYFLAYSIFQIPIGIILDRYGVKWPLIFAIFLCSTGTAIFSQATMIYQADIARLLIGFGSSFAALSCLQLSALWFPANRFAFLTGLLLTVGMLGAILGEKPLALWLAQSSWQHVIQYLSFIGIILLCTVLICMPNRRANYTPIDNKSALIRKCLFILRHSKSWLIAGYGMFMFTPFLCFASLWGVPFIVSTTQQSQASAAGLISWMLIGFAIGAPVLGWIADKPFLKFKVLFSASMASLLSLISLIYFTYSLSKISFVLFCFGFSTSGFLPAFSLMREAHGPDIRATSLGFMNMLNMLGTWVCLPIIGWLLDFNHGQTLQSHHVLIQFSAKDFRLALTLCPLLLCFAILTLIRLQYKTNQRG